MLEFEILLNKVGKSTKVTKLKGKVTCGNATAFFVSKFYKYQGTFITIDIVIWSYKQKRIFAPIFRIPESAAKSNAVKSADIWNISPNPILSKNNYLPNPSNKNNNSIFLSF